MSSSPSQHKAGILWSSFGPYHVARIVAADKALKSAACELTAFRFTEKSGTYGWEAENPAETPVVTLSGTQPQGLRQSLVVAWRFLKELRSRSIQSVFLPSFSPLPNTLCLLAAWASGRRIILMTESWEATGKQSAGSRIMKRFLTVLCDAALVGGTPQKRYLAGLGMPESRIFTGYDVIDVDHFTKAAKNIRSGKAEPDDDINPWLPDRYFLSLGRFVQKKNLSLLVEAYAMAKREKPEIKSKLVMVGEGPEKASLEERAKAAGLVCVDAPNPGEIAAEADVYFYPFQQIDRTPRFFALAEAFILPSLWEEWGLVVNEAMACGTPVIVSNKVGAGFDLVENGTNGFVFDPESTGGLKDLLLRFIEDPTLRERLGTAGAEKILDWGPGLFGASALAAWKAAQST